MTSTHPAQGETQMRLEIDPTKCCGYGNCVLVAPDLFDLDDATNLAVVRVDELDDTSRSDAERAMDECPTLAITMRS
jgi:ferredoxin